MSVKRFILAFIAVFIASSLFNFLIHGVLLTPEYKAQAFLMRGQADGQIHAPFLILSFLFFSIAFVWIYAQGVADKPWVGQGIRYAIAVWLIASVSRYLCYYAIQPWTADTIFKQIGYELVMMLILGILVAVFFRPPATTA